MGRSATMPVPLVVSTLAEKSWAGSSASPRKSFTTTVARELAPISRSWFRVVPSPSM